MEPLHEYEICVIEQLFIAKQYGLDIKSLDKKVLESLHKRGFIILANSDCAKYGDDYTCDYTITPTGIDNVDIINIKKYGNIDYNRLKCYYLIKYLAISTLCDLKYNDLSFRVRSDCELVRKSNEERWLCRMDAACNGFSTEQLGSILHWFGNERCEWQTKVYNYLVNYIVDHKICFDNNYEESKTKHFLFGNGIAIGLAGDDFKNERIMKLFNDMLSLPQKEKLNDLIEYIKFFLFEYNDEIEKQAVKQHNYFMVKNKQYLSTFHNADIYTLLFDKYNDSNNKIDLDNVSIEELELFEMIYSANKNIVGYELKNEQIPIDYRLFFYQIVKDIEQIAIIKKQLIKEKFKDSKIFTTNYDELLEKSLPDNIIIHLHGSIKGNDIVTGADYYEKLLMMGSPCTRPYDWQEYLKNENMKKLNLVGGDLIIVGYGANYNDEHINAVIRNNQNIKNIIFFTSESELKQYINNKQDKYRLVKFLTRYDDTKRIIVKNFNEFYDEYSKQC